MSRLEKGNLERLDQLTRDLEKLTLGLSKKFPTHPLASAVVVTGGVIYHSSEWYSSKD